MWREVGKLICFYSVCFIMLFIFVDMFNLERLIVMIIIVFYLDWVFVRLDEDEWFRGLLILVFDEFLMIFSLWCLGRLVFILVEIRCVIDID